MSIENQITYSVILPHYNSYGLLRRALDSIPLRQDIQVIVVDDFSTEPSIQDISEDSAYSHVDFVFSRKKITAGGARNTGLQRAKGEYIIFADSDDYFIDGSFDLFDEKVRSQYDLYQFTVTSFLEGSSDVGTRHNYLKNIYKLKGLSRYLSIEQPVAKIIRHVFLKENVISFNEVPAANDVIFSAKVAIFSQEKEFINDVVYAISQNKYSITATQTNENICSRIIEQIKKNQLIISATSIWFWINYLPRRNIYKTTEHYLIDQYQYPKNIVTLSRKYHQKTPKIVYIAYRCIQFFANIKKILK